MRNILIVVSFLTFTLSSFAGDTLKIERKNKFDRKFLAGISFNNSWSKITGVQSEMDVFTRPSLGGHLKLEYFPIKWVGLSLGAGIQQRGTGIKTPDYYSGIGDADSTHRLRLRSLNYDFPILLMIRPPYELIKGVRFSAGFGICPTMVFNGEKKWYSIEDGFHEITDVTNQFTKWDVPYRFTAGLDVNPGNSCVFRVNFVSDWGTKLLFQSQNNSNQQIGKNKLTGIEFICLF